MKDSTEILIIRHGQTDWNKRKLLQGHSDIPLNEKGMSQALSLAEILEKESLDSIFSSDLMRAAATANEIAKRHDLTVSADAGLRERCYGIFEGMHPQDIEEMYPDSHAAWHAADPDHRFPEGERVAESIREFHYRAMETLARCARPHAGGKIAIIAHFGIVESAYRAAHSIPLGQRLRFPVMNTSINRFAMKGDKIKLLAWGESDHLEPEKTPTNYVAHY